MTKNQKIIIGLIAIFVIIVFILVWWFGSLSKDEGKTKILESFIDTYIFGSPEDGGGLFGGQGEDVVVDERLPKLRKITSSPTAGFVVFSDKKGKTIIRYIEKATGHIYEASIDSTTIERISNTTIPRIQNAVWVDKDNTILTYLEGETVKSFYAKVVQSDEEGITTIGKTEGVFLWDDILGLVPTAKQIIYFIEEEGNSHFFVSDLDGENEIKLFDTPITEWLIQRPKEGILSLTTKPSSRISGYTYLVNLNDGKLNKILSRTFGLTTLVNNNADALIYSQSRQGKPALSLHSIKEGVQSSLSVDTFPEKCVWGVDDIYVYCGVPTEIELREYPDVWYQGLVSFSDNIIKIDTRDREFSILASPSVLVREEIDLIKPSLSPNEDNLFFINKKDSSLWVLELIENFIEDENKNETATSTEEVTS